MYQALLSPEGFGPALLAVLLAWTPVFVPIAYLVTWGRSLPKKIYFVAVCSALTLGLPVFFLMGLEAPLLVIQPLYEMLVFDRGLHERAPFSWILVALDTVSRWWWLATFIAFTAGALIWSAAVVWWLGRRWPAIATALLAHKAHRSGGSANDA
jgi:hypothetical protein